MVARLEADEDGRADVFRLAVSTKANYWDRGRPARNEREARQFSLHTSVFLCFLNQALL
jgi:hypothetical protein